MTQFFPFTPRPRQAFSFQPILDGRTTTAVVSWNIGGMRWFVSVYDLNGTRILTLPAVGSGDPANASASWDGLRRRVLLITQVPHGLTIGTRASLTVAGFTPAAYCGVFDCDVLTPVVLAYSMPDDPGAVVTSGTICPEIDLCGGYFASRMIYRESARRFEVTP